MISFILANVCFIIFVYNIYAYLFARPKNFPPGKMFDFVELVYPKKTINYNHLEIDVKLCFRKF